MPIILPKPYPAQQRVLEQQKRNNLLVLSRRWGKTTLTGRLLMFTALTTPCYRAAFSAPTWKLMIETFEHHRNTLTEAITRVNREDRRIELENKSVIEYWSSDDIQAGRGRKYHLWVADEMQRQRNLLKFVRGSVRPTLADYRGQLWVLGTANGEGTEFHELYLESLQDESWFVAEGTIDDNPYIHPDEIAQMRQDLGPEVAAQELDSKWVRVGGIAPLVRKVQWDALYGEAENRTTKRVLAVDASVSGDKTAIIAVWKDGEHFYIDYDDIILIDPEPFTGQVDYLALEEVVWEKWVTGRYSTICYDPYQLVGLMQRLRARGVVPFEFTQNNMRLRGDGFLRQLINEARIHHPDHPLLNEHVLNATLKYTNDSTFRFVKASKGQKIDLAVALSMACWTIHELGAEGMHEYHPVVASAAPAPQVNSHRISTPYFGTTQNSPFAASNRESDKNFLTRLMNGYRR